MKINEIIVEEANITKINKASVDDDKNNDGIPDSHQTATPGMRSHHKLDNSSPYAPWRFAAYFLGGAGADDGKYEHEPNKEGPNGQSLVTVAYSKGEKQILDQASKAFGPEASSFIQLTPDGSSEVQQVNTVSPTRKVGPIQLKKKK